VTRVDPSRGKALQPQGAARETIRLDKWLWRARCFRSRSLARSAIEEGHLRLNGARVLRPSVAVGAGDVLTFVQGGRVRVLRILAAGLRRGPATEAATLFAELEPPSAPAPVAPPVLPPVLPDAPAGPLD
jgi:ribosome-associated heat shock protein Hsp15